MKPLEQIPKYLEELSDLLESNLSDKRKFVELLASKYEAHKEEIQEIFESWEGLSDIPSEMPSSNMDVGFYKALSEEQGANITEMKPAPKKSNLVRMRWLAAAATFVIGMMLGTQFDFNRGSNNDTQQQEQMIQNDRLSFASVEKTPSAGKRIKKINKFKEQETVDTELIHALNKVILNDPNVNVRLSAIETMVLFSDIPEARTALVRAIPYQTSSIVLLELAAIMSELEETESIDAWEKVIDSGELDTDVKMNLEESLKTIL